MRMRWMATAVAGVALSASAAPAAPQRIPLTGAPAVTLEIPDGWNIGRPGISLNAANPQRNGVISVTIEETLPGFDLTQFRDNVFKAANCASLDRPETVRIGGRVAQAWYCQPTQGALAPARVALIRLGSTHVLSISYTYRLDASGADIQALERVIQSIRYEDAP